MLEKRLLSDAIAEAIERVFENIGGSVNIGVYENGEFIGISYCSSQLAQWDYTEEEWANMDFYCLAEEQLEGLGLEDREGFYQVICI